MDLKFRVADIPPDGIEIPLNIASDKGRVLMTEKDNDSIRLNDAILGSVRLEPSGRRIVVKGRVKAAFKADCSRCLEEFELPVAEEFLIVFTPSSEGARPEELEAEALNQEIFDGEEIDIRPVIREYLLIGLPIKPLCSNDCSGLCPDCGKNLNDGPCGCSRKATHPGLAALKSIRDKLPE